MKGVKKENHFNWKGEDAKYISKHTWIHNNYGKASKCEVCNMGGKNYEWANISGEYKRDISDYKQMCRSCHRLMDFSRTGMCRNGHKFTKENTYIRRNGYKVCITCQKLGAERFKNKKELVNS